MQTTSITFTAPNINALRVQMNAFLGEETSPSVTAPVAQAASRSTRKAAAPVVEEEFDLDNDVSEADSETEVEPEETTLDDVVNAFKAFATAKPANKVKAQAVLAKLGVKSVRDIKESQYTKAISLLK